ncbi:ABC transporter permease [Actinoplanes solisilvae]|uniref:ABC transporter permease n=1 Tax=Actinoplanes solisilvae TaxID=2486853 RepID=UPI000FD92B82|nr:ABC transporter permease [Actinoplanes solisilvae]
MSTDVMAAEWLKLRTVRSTSAFLVAAAAATLLGMTLLFLLIQAFDAATTAEQANFETADPTVVIMPFVMFFIGAIGALSITGSPDPGLLAVPHRRLLLASKAAVSGAIGLLAGGAFALLSFIGARLLLGDRPPPLNPWPEWTDALPTIGCTALVVAVTSVVGVGLGAVLRSTAATLLTLGGLILVAPTLAHFLPTVWHLRLATVLLPNLTPQITGADHPYLLSRPGAVVVLAGYMIVALVAGALALGRRDVS